MVEKIVKDNMGLVYAQLRYYGMIHDQDALSYGMEALFKAAQTYDSEQGSKFSTYATVCIYNSLGSYGRTLKNKARYVPIESVDDYGFCEEDCKLSQLEGLKTVWESVWKTVNGFKGKKKEVILSWIDSNFKLSVQELAANNACSVASASNYLGEFKKLLKEELHHAKHRKGHF